MKKNVYNIIIVILIGIIVGIIAYILLFVNKVRITSISLNKHNLSLIVGKSDKLEVSIVPLDATDEVIWESSDTNIVSITNNGLVVGKSIGNAIITAKTKNGKVSDRCAIKVLNNEADELNFLEENVEITVNESKKLNITISPQELEKEIIWTSSDESVVLVNNGEITGVKRGQTTIKASYGSKEVLCNIKVIVPIVSMIMEKESITLNVNESEELKVITIPEIIYNDEIKWESSDESVIKVVDGKITAIGSGESLITATYGNMKATCIVTVVTPVSNIKLNKNTLSLKEGSSETLIATILPSNATNKKIQWTSSNDRIVTVDVNGKVTGKKTGKVTITATIEGKKATCEVTSIGFIITQDRNFSGYSTVASYNSSTLKYRIMRKGGNDFSLVWVMDANKQWNSAMPKLGSRFKSSEILSREIKQYGYQKKGLIATNGSTFWDQWGDYPCTPFVINKGKILLDIKNTDYNKKVYGLLTMTSENNLKKFNFSSNDYTKNQKIKKELLAAGVRNGFTTFGRLVLADGRIANGNWKGKRTALCQIDENNFVIYSGETLTHSQIASEFKNTFKCKTSYIFDGGSSRTLYYKTGSMSEAKVVHNGRELPDMMYFVEQ